MKIYLASSWKNAFMVMNTKGLLVKEGHEVDAFCDKDGHRFVFCFDQLGDISYMNNMNIRNNLKVQKAFFEDKKWLDWADCCVMMLPCGKSAHLEAGYAKGQGKKLIIFSPNGFPDGDIDVMYGFADFITASYISLIDQLKIYGG